MFDSNQFFGGERGFYPLTIEQSLRFDDDSSSYLSRTPASAGNRKTWTWSGWVKRCTLNGSNVNRIITAYQNDDNFTDIRFNNDDAINLRQKTSNVEKANYSTQAVYRDVSAWYHIVLEIDTTNATAADRFKIYVNGVQQLLSTTTTYPQNQDTFFNHTSSDNAMGAALENAGATRFFDGYLAEVHFTDGTAYDADAFGELKSGVWVAKTPSVTYGTNGFYLDFANSADIGNDVSGEGNDWTPNNFTASDVVLDSPTDNFCVLNPLKKSGIDLSDGSLKLARSSSASDWDTVHATIAPSSGKWYWEVTLDSGSNDGLASGVAIPDSTTTQELTEYYGYGTSGYAVFDGSFAGPNTTLATGDILQVAFDRDNNKIWFGKNNTWGLYGGTPVTPTDPNSNHTNLPEGLIPYAAARSTAIGTINFGQLGFEYTPPTGYLALSTANLPEPTISPADDASPEDYFNTVTYTGNSSNPASVTGVGFQPDFVWVKTRSFGNTNHRLQDVVRGSNKRLMSDLTNAETDAAGGIQSFDSDGFTVGDGTSKDGFIHFGGRTFVAWNWKANGSGVSNTDGSITSTVSANTESGFSIITYTGNSTDGSTIGHGLNSKPSALIVKKRNNSEQWGVALDSQGYGSYLLFLESKSGGGANSSVFQSGTNDTTVQVGVDGIANNNGDTYVMYAFSDVDGFSKCSSYTGNGSTDGPFVYTGFRPAFVLSKGLFSKDWVMVDNKRNTYNVVNKELFPNQSFAESTNDRLDFVSNGFKVTSSGAQWNNNGSTYIYMAFAENPFKYSNAR